MNSLFIKVIITSLLQVLKDQCRYEASIGKPFNWGTASVSYDICGQIGVMSGIFQGTVILCFPQSTYLGIMGAMFGQTFEAISDDIADGAGELLNMVFGTAKTTLTNQNIPVQMALPSTIRGKDLILNVGRADATITFPFEGPLGPLYLVVSTKSEANNVS